MPLFIVKEPTNSISRHFISASKAKAHGTTRISIEAYLHLHFLNAWQLNVDDARYGQVDCIGVRGRWVSAERGFKRIEQTLGLEGFQGPGIAFEYEDSEGWNK